MPLSKFFAFLCHKGNRHCLPTINTEKDPVSSHNTLVFTKATPDSFEMEEPKLCDSITSSTEPRAIYDGGYGQPKGSCIRLRIANGGAGQIGLIQTWADTFIHHMVSKGHKPFQVAWYLGDTTESLSLLCAGEVDFALTYNPAAEAQVMRAGNASKRVYAFRDHFMLVGPTANPANLSEEDDVLAMFNKIVSCGNADAATPPKKRAPTRFLSRFDKSATNIKETLLFATIGQVPWAFDYSKWYHQYPCFPREALQAASLLSEYTLIDKGSWLDAPRDIRSKLKLFKEGSDDPDDILLNPAHLLFGTRVSQENEEICWEFLSWVLSQDGGQRVIETFRRSGHVLYSRAP
ncbi:hypothetical protein CVT26_003448 [Gymnopilus dilepis]|uniref:PBP domain-containing protein n=1 Tax=Gymnopilus dilepis TaxID=231916 RepID=A0A409Y5E1_9AGAR|nr:hypothetical protein CVT26_003448 [Gymnopilus dilepis]